MKTSFGFQLRSWLRVLLLASAGAASAGVIAFAYAVRRLVDFILCPAAQRIPQPGEIVVVIGASTGIGESAARHLQARGFQVFAGVRSRPDRDRLERLGLRTLILDVTKPDQIAAAVHAIPDHDVLAAVVCNAGIVVPGALEDLTDDDVRSMVDVNLTGAVLAAKAFLPRLRRDRGRLLMTGSVLGFLPQAGMAVYTGTKFALRGLVLALAQELRPVGVSVSLIEPGLIATPIVDKSRDALRKLPPNSLYDGLMRLCRQQLTTIPGGQPQRTTDVAIYHALTDRCPALRYRTPVVAEIGAFVSECPAELGDCLPTAYRAVNGFDLGWTH